jgi:autotransporter-associated beta strand protein
MKNPPLHMSLRAATKRLLVGMATFLGCLAAANANLVYTFTGTGTNGDTPNREGWTSVYLAEWGKYFWWGSDGNIGDGWADAEAQLAHSPEFKLNGSGPLTFQMIGLPSSPAPSPVSTAGVPATNSASIPATAIVGGGFMGVALREVATDTYVLWKPHVATDFNLLSSSTAAWPNQSFSQAELAPYSNNGKIYTLDFIDNNKSPNGDDHWVTLGSVTIPGNAVSVEKTYDFNDGTLQGWHNRVWDATTSAWVDLAPDLKTMPSSINGGAIQPPSVDNNLFSNNGTKIEPVGGDINNHLNTLWLRSPVFKLAPYKDLTAKLEGGEVGGELPSNDVSVSFAAGDAGWKGVALRTVTDGAFVLSKPTTSFDSNSVETVTFTQAELAPYVGLNCTLDLINSHNVVFGGLKMDDVSIPVPPSNACEMLTFGTSGVISGTNVSMFVPFGTNLATLAPSCTVSPGASFTGPTPSFSVANPSSYVVTAQDGTLKTYTITIGFGAPSTACDLLTFTFPGQLDTVISGLNVSLAVPVSANVTNLMPTYTASPFAVGSPASGTAKDFTTPQSYTITAQDGSASKTYLITVTKGAVPTIFSWNTAGVGDWSDASKWTNDLGSGAKPANAGFANYVLNFNQPGTYTTTNNLSASFALNQLNLASTMTLAGTGALVFSADGVTLPTINQNSTGGAVVSSPVDFTAATTLGGSGNGPLTLGGLVSGPGSLTKNGSGTLVMYGFNSGGNTYSGGTTITTGRLQLGAVVDGVTPVSINPLGTGAVTLSGNTVIELNRVQNSNTLIVNGGTIANSNGWNSAWNGPIALNETLGFDIPGGEVAVSGAVSGVGGITKTGNGRVSFSGTNTYSGDTTVNGGTLAVNGASISDLGKLILSGGSVAATGTETVTTLFFGAVQQAAGTWGATGSGATHIDDVHFSGTTGMVSVLVGPSAVSDFDAWLGTFSTITLPADKLPTADPDGDGMTNQQEYAFGLNPASASSANPIAASLSSTTGKFSYTRRATPATTGLIYTILTSPNLVTWTEDVGAAQTVVTSSNVETVTFTLSNTATTGKMFVRVKASSAP